MVARFIPRANMCHGGMALWTAHNIHGRMKFKRPMSAKVPNENAFDGLGIITP